MDSILTQAKPRDCPLVKKKRPNAVGHLCKQFRMSQSYVVSNHSGSKDGKPQPRYFPKSNHVLFVPKPKQTVTISQL